MSPPPDAQEQAGDSIDALEAKEQIKYLEKALNSQSPQERRVALAEGFMAFGFRFIEPLRYLAQRAENDGPFQELMIDSQSVLLDWLNGKQMTERADEDDLRARFAMTILESGPAGLGRLAANVILDLTEDHPLRNVKLAQQTLKQLLAQSQADGEVDAQLLITAALLSHELEPLQKALELLRAGQLIVEQPGASESRHDFWVAAAGYYLELARVDASEGKSTSQLEWAGAAEKILAQIRANEPDFFQTPKGRNLYALAMFFGAKPAATVAAAFGATVDASDPHDTSYQVAAVIEKRFRMDLGEYERVVKIISPVVRIFEEKYLAAVVNQTIEEEGERFSEAVWMLAFAHAHLGQWAEAFAALESGKSPRLRYQAAIRQSPAGRRFLQLETYLYALERGVPLDVAEFKRGRHADPLGEQIPLRTRILEEYRRQRLQLPKELPPPPSIREIASTLGSGEAVVSLGAINPGGTMLTVICPGDDQLPSGRFLLGDWPLSRWVPLFAGEQEDGWMYAVAAPEAGVDHKHALAKLLRGVDEVIGKRLGEFLRSREIKRVTIIPHLWFHVVPFWALPSLAEFEVLIAASASHFAQTRQAQQVQQLRALVVADPTSDLPASLTEAETVTRHLSQLGFAVKQLHGKDATEEALVTNLDDISIFHFCGHGQSNFDHPTRSALLVCPDLSRLPAATEWRSGEVGSDPLQTLRATVNEWQDGEEDERYADLPGIGRFYEQQFPRNKTVELRLEYGARGTLWQRCYDEEPGLLVELWTAGDILVQESLRHCRLAFLSACEAGSGGGIDISTDEYSGLPSALQLAGVSTIICSLWPVSDALTALYVDLFYQALVQAGPQVKVAALVKTVNERLHGMKKEEAVSLLDELRRQSIDPMARITQEVFIEQIKEADGPPFENPYDWAAFYVTGTGDLTFSQGELM